MMRYLLLLLSLAVLTGCGEKAPVETPVETSSTAPINLAAELARAKTEGKWVLLDFTGSDWCEPCKMLQREILSQAEFKQYAAANLIFHEVDFPVRTKLPPDTQATNELLQGRFEVEGFPTLVALDGDGKVVWKNLGLIPGGPAALISQLEAAKKKPE
jgi:thiol:disulfide interchange protein